MLWRRSMHACPGRLWEMWRVSENWMRKNFKGGLLVQNISRCFGHLWQMGVKVTRPLLTNGTTESVCFKTETWLFDICDVKMIKVYKNTEIKNLKDTENTQRDTVTVMHEIEMCSVLLNGGMYYGTQKLKIFHIFTFIGVYILFQIIRIKCEWF